MGRSIAAALAIATMAPAQASADEPSADKEPPLDPRRRELAAFPILGGNTDIGVQFGAALTLTRFRDEARPYLWNLDLVASGSVKSDPTGLRVIQQSHVVRIDLPDLFQGRLRVDALAGFQRTINEGYYGVGNASEEGSIHGETSIGRRYQFIQQEARTRFIARVRTKSPIDIAVGGHFRFVAPEVYAGTKLAEDAAASTIRGTDPIALAGGAIGVMIDRRDSEFITTRGIFYQLGLGGTAGSGDGVGYGEASAALAHYAPIGRGFIFASRIVASFQFGNAPFYDLARGGVFDPAYLLGGENGVRGVPRGRYAGLAKTISNFEIRRPFGHFRVLGQRVRPGATVFFDAGRVWSDYKSDPLRDGRKLDLKFGVGGGGFLQWGEAAIIRVEVAYSPDAQAENPGFPLGIYVSEGLIF